MKTILWLPGWYPSTKDVLTGDFIQRHARAVSLYTPVRVIFVVKDEAAGGNLRIDETITGRLHETVAYFKPFKTGIKSLDRIISILTYRKISRQLVNTFIQQEGLPPLVHVHVALWGGITARWLKKKYKIPYILTEHWTGYDRNAQGSFYTKDILYRNYIKKVLQGAELLLPVSDHLGKLIRKDFAAVPCKVIPNVVDTAYFNPGNDYIPAFRFIHVSAMNYQKNCEGILRSFAKLHAQQNTVTLVMVGPAPAELKLLAAQLQLQYNVSWTGEITYREVAILVKQASCFIMFSRYENLPCAILEALCCGLPVIATHTGGIPEIIHAANGLLVHSENEDELLSAMATMIEKNTDYDKFSIAKKAMDAFNYETVGKQLADVYQELLIRRN